MRQNTGVSYLNDPDVQKVIKLYNELGGTGNLIDILASLYDFPDNKKDGLFQTIAKKLRVVVDIIETGNYETKRDDNLSLLIRARDYVQQTINDLGGCDHSVGVCMCEDIRLAEDLDEAIKGAS